MRRIRRLLAGTVVLGVAGALVAAPATSAYDARPSPDTVVLAAAHRVESAVIAEPVVVRRHDEDQHPGVTRTGTPWAAISRTGTDQIPLAALRAYQQAAAVMDRAVPSCRLPWTLLAAIGRVESDHGRFGGSHLGTDGLARPGILGLRLDGHGPVAAVPDSDNGALDHDRTWDRAVGPMQLIPGTWRLVAVDGDGDGVRNPQDINDAALAAAVYLCAGHDNLATPTGMASAAFRYNPSHHYVAAVLGYARAYGAAGLPKTRPVFAAHRLGHAHPSRTADAGRALTRTTPAKPRHASSTPTPRPTSTSTSPATSAASPSPVTATPTPAPVSPSPSPTPTPTPAPPALTTLTGTWTTCPAPGTNAPGTGSTDTTAPPAYCLDDTALDLGLDDPEQLAAVAAPDFDGDGVVESNADELTGLVGSAVTLQVVPDTDPATVVTIDDARYRADDGTLVPGAPDPNGP